MSNHYTFRTKSHEGRLSDVYGIMDGRRCLTIARNFPEAMRIGQRLSVAQPDNEIQVIKNADLIHTFGPVDDKFGAEVLY
jgi:hypothetical protein